MIKQDLETLYKSGYSRKQLCWIILTCLDIITELNKEVKQNDLNKIRNPSS